MGDFRTRQVSALAALVSALMLGLASSGTQADTDSKPAPRSDKPLWEIGAGVGAISFPDFRGADHYRLLAAPVPTIIYRGKWLRVARDDTHALLLDTPRFNINITGGGAPPVNSDADNRRAGMPDLDATFNVGPSFDWTLTDPDSPDNRLRFRLPVRAAFKASVRNFEYLGVLLRPELVYTRRWRGPGHEWSLSVDGGPLWSSARYHRFYYNVAPRFARPGRRAYQADGGYGGVRIGAGVYRHAGRLRFGAYTSYDDLHGAAFADSPLVADKHSYIVGAFVTWVFWRSETRAPHRNRGDAPYE